MIGTHVGAKLRSVGASISVSVKKIFVWGAGAFVAGLLMILLALYLERAFATPPSHEQALLLRFLDHIGIALVLIGVVALLQRDRSRLPTRSSLYTPRRVDPGLR